MALTDHVAILLHHSLDRAVPSPKNKAKIQYYAVIAIPPAAAPAVGEMISKIYPGVNLGQVEFNCKPNAEQLKPYPGVPNDWYVFRLASNYAPELYAADGHTIIPNQEARGRFFAGMKVRVAGSAWPRTGDKGPGASFNLFGVMDAGQGGERLSIGNGATGAAFAAHGNPAAAPQNGTGGAGSPFGAQTQSAQSAQSNPFGGQAAASGNPFQQITGATAQSANPFA